MKYFILTFTIIIIFNYLKYLNLGYYLKRVGFRDGFRAEQGEVMSKFMGSYINLI